MSDTIDVSVFMTLHVGDFLRDTGHLSNAEMGAHVRLLIACWSRGGHLPSDPERLRRLAGVDLPDWKSVWPALVELWTPSENGTTVSHARTLEQIERARTSRAQAIARGRASQAARRPRPDQDQPKPEPSGDSPETVSKPSQDCLEPPNSELRTPIPEPRTPNSEHQEDICPAGGPAGPGGVGDAPLLQLVPGGKEPDAKTRKPAKPDSVHAIWTVYKHYWHQHNHPQRQPNKASKTYRAIAARLRDGWSVEDLCRAIDGYHLDPWHAGKNPESKTHLELDLIVRDEEHVQKGIEWVNNPPKPGNGTSAGRDIRVGHVRAEDCVHTQVGEIKL